MGFRLKNVAINFPNFNKPSYLIVFRIGHIDLIDHILYVCVF